MKDRGSGLEKLVEDLHGVNMKDRGNGLEKLVEDLHGVMWDWGFNEGIDILQVRENVTSQVMT